MSNPKYIAGRRLEYETMKRWKERGYEALRSAGSHSSADVVAFRLDRKPEIIQCKVVQTESIANRLIKKFKAETASSHFYHKNLTIRIKGYKLPIEVTI